MGETEGTKSGGLGVWNEAGQRLIEFCQENTLVIASTLFQQHKRRLYTWTSPDGQHWNQIDYILCSQRWRSSTQSAKTKTQRGKPGLAPMGEAMLSKSLIQFFVEGWGCVPSLLFDLRPNYGGGNEDNSDLLQKIPCTHCYTQCPDSAVGHCWPTAPPETHGHSWARLGQSLVGSLLFSPGS